MSVMLSKTAALKVASDAHGAIFKKGSGYSFTAPWRISEPYGPSVEIDFVGHWAARQGRAIRVACMALEYMGYDTPTANSLTCDQQGSTRAILDQAIKRKPL